MSASGRISRLLITVSLFAACTEPTTPSKVPPDPLAAPGCGALASDTPKAAAERWGATPDVALRTKCIHGWVRSHAGSGVAVAAALVQARPKDPLALAGALTLLKGEPPGRARIDGLLDLGDAAFEAQQADVGKEALALSSADLGSLSLPAAELVPIRVRQGKLNEQAGDRSAALQQFGEAIQDDDIALSPVKPAVGLLLSSMTASGSAETRVQAMCNDLLQRGRLAQALACAEAGKAGGVNQTSEFLFEVLSRRSTLEPADVSMVAGTASDVTIKLVSRVASRCETKPEVAIDLAEPWDGVKHGRFDEKFGEISTRGAQKVFTRLAESAADPGHALCYQSLAAGACIYQLTKEGDCADIRSLARFAAAIAGQSPGRLEVLDKWLFRLKGARKIGGLYNAATGSVVARRALFHMHLALAHMFTDPKLRVSAQPSHTPEFQLCHARGWWREIHGGGSASKPVPPIPEDMLEGLPKSEKICDPLSN